MKNKIFYIISFVVSALSFSFIYLFQDTLNSMQYFILMIFPMIPMAVGVYIKQIQAKTQLNFKTMGAFMACYMVPFLVFIIFGSSAINTIILHSPAMFTETRPTGIQVSDLVVPVLFTSILSFGAKYVALKRNKSIEDKLEECYE